jgi:Fe-Mn family superoxide dismutase
MNDTIDSQRRALLAAAASATAFSLTGTAAAGQVDNHSSIRSATAFQSPTELKPLAFNPARLDGLSERLIRSHWENNYGGSVRALSVVKQHIADALADKDMPAFIYNELKREHLVRTGSVVLHEYYFDNLGGDGKAGSAERTALANAFGSFDTWETEFRRIGAGLGGGSGWVVLAYNTHTQGLENYWLADHAHGAAATLPILVMDMYEHSYQMDYGAATAKYIDAFFRNIQWDAVAARIESARRMGA